MATITIEQFRKMKAQGRRGGSQATRAANPAAPKGSALERAFETQWTIVGGPECVREYRFMPGRKWRFDFAWPTAKVALEIEGGEWCQNDRRSRHTRGRGYANDCLKYNAATVMGWRVIRATGEMVTTDPISVMEDLADLLCVKLNV